MKRYFGFLLFFSSLFAAMDLSQLPSPYNTLTVLLPEKNHGWYSNAREMQGLLKGKSIHTVIEIGSWLGMSTRNIARLIPDDGKVYAVDHWLGSVEHHNTSAFSRYLPSLYEQFLSNVVHAHLEHKIIPIRMASLDAAKVLTDVQPDLIYLDGSHETEDVYQDLVAWFPYVENKKGIFSGDDWNWESVRIAVNQFASERNLIIHAANNFWWLEER